MVAVESHTVPAPLTPLVHQLINITFHFDCQFGTAGFILIHIFHRNTLMHNHSFLFRTELNGGSHLTQRHEGANRCALTVLGMIADIKLIPSSLWSIYFSRSHAMSVNDLIS